VTSQALWAATVRNDFRMTADSCHGRVAAKFLKASLAGTHMTRTKNILQGGNFNVEIELARFMRFSIPFGPESGQRR
jgi:hypothetical protein